MANIERPILRYILIFGTIIGILVFGYNTLFPKQYTEIEFGMSQEDLIKLKGEADEIVVSDDKTYLIFRYSNDKHLGYKCKSWFRFSKSFFDKNKYDKLMAFGYNYTDTGMNLDDDKNIYSELRDSLIKLYGRETFMDNFDKFNETYNEGEIILTLWGNKREEVCLLCNKEHRITVYYKKQ